MSKPETGGKGVLGMTENTLSLVSRGYSSRSA